MALQWDTEHYPVAEDDDTNIGQEIYDKGLIFLVNQNALHHYGYAMGVEVGKEGQVTGLSLHKTSDPEGIWFDETTIRVGRDKLQAAGLR